MKKRKVKLFTTHEEHLDLQYGKRGTKKREAYERGFQKFYQQVMAEIEQDKKIKPAKKRLSNTTTSRATFRP